MGPFQIFSKIRGDIQDAPPVLLTLVANEKNLQSEKFELFVTPLCSRINI
jgi:hypothetical protein